MMWQEITWQEIVVAFFVAAALAFILYHYCPFRKKKSGDCSGCNGCDNKNCK